MSSTSEGLTLISPVGVKYCCYGYLQLSVPCALVKTQFTKTMFLVSKYPFLRNGCKQI